MDSSNSNEYGAFIGRVDWFDSRKGYGFIQDMSNDSNDDSNDGSNNGKGTFVHFSDIVVSDTDRMYRKLHPGEYVSYDVGDRDGKSVCLNVGGVNGGPLLTENTQYRYRVWRDHQNDQNDRDNGQDNGDNGDDGQDNEDDNGDQEEGPDPESEQ